ncbi:MAG: TauD/TfdA family dioxygenase [Methyloligellaceae bacterium]
MTSNRLMPDGPVEGPAIWRGEDLAGRDDWILQMSPVMVNEIIDAGAEARTRGLKPTAFGREDFPLRSCRPEFERILEELEHGNGFALIRGLPAQQVSAEELEIIFWGIGAHLGTAVSQNADGHLLGHVRNLDHDINKTDVRGYQTTVQLAYHCDQSDVIGLLCIQPAKSGGQSSLVSVTAVHNEMMRRRPDLLRELYQPFYIDRRGELGRPDEGDEPYYAIPVLSYHNGLVNARYIRGYIRSCQRFPEVPRLTDTQIEALDMFDALAQSEGIALDFFMQPGDIQLVNNYSVLHSRTSFEDWPEPERRRHMLRLWLCVPNSRELPSCFESRFGSCEAGAVRGAIPPRRNAGVAPAESFALDRL